MSYKLNPKDKQHDEYKLVNDRTQFTTYMTLTNEDGKKQLYRNVGKDVDDNTVFKKANPLGLTNFTLEYDKKVVSLQSMYDENNKTGEVRIAKTTTKLWNKTNVGIAFNLMSKHVDWERDDLFHVDLDTIGLFCSEFLSRNFVIRHDYKLFEYTIYCYK